MADFRTFCVKVDSDPEVHFRLALQSRDVAALADVINALDKLGVPTNLLFCTHQW